MMVKRILGAGARGSALLAAALFCALAQSQAIATLTSEQRTRLEKTVLDKGTSIPVPPDIGRLLRLTPSQTAPLIRQASIQEPDDIKHGFALLNDGSGYLMTRRTSGNSLCVLRVDRDFHLLGGVQNFRNDRFIALTDADAQVELQTEIAAWAKVLAAARAPVPAGAPPPATAPAKQR